MAECLDGQAQRRPRPDDMSDKQRRHDERLSRNQLVALQGGADSSNTGAVVATCVPLLSVELEDLSVRNRID